ncbi:MAG: hypothetical protein ACU0CA_00380 [Paracoccaceae bacterium]
MRRSGDDPTPLWATQVMLDHPGMVEEIHRDYFEAEATVDALEARCDLGRHILRN